MDLALGHKPAIAEPLEKLTTDGFWRIIEAVSSAVAFSQRGRRRFRSTS